MKSNVQRRPDLAGLPPDLWLTACIRQLEAKVLPIDERVAPEAARVPTVYGAGDPGDCFLIATARVHGLTLATHDKRMLDLSSRKPEYVSILAC